MLKKFAVLLLTVFLCACSAHPSSNAVYTKSASIQPVLERKVDKVVVKKSINKMYLMKGDRPIRTYHIALGANPVGHKVQEGDHRTPEGRYMLNYKNTKSKFYKSINIDYPNERDIEIARLRGVDPGDDIVIHGFPNNLGNVRGPVHPQNWTQGCIGVRNHEMDEIWHLVELDTPIEIYP